jgi:ABC-type sugar transport system substrate-binding protein
VWPRFRTSRKAIVTEPLQQTFPATARRRAATAAFVLAAVVVSVGGCEDSGSIPRPSERSGEIGFIGASRQDPLWRVLYATAMREVRSYRGFELRTDAPHFASHYAQAQIIREMYSEKLLGLCVQPVDPIAIRDQLEQLRTKGVAVVVMFNSVESANHFLFAGVDEMAAGRALGDALLETLGNGTAAVILSGTPTPGASVRYLGFKERMAASAGVTILKELDCRGDVDLAHRLLREFTERYPRLDAVVSVEDWPLRRRSVQERILPANCRLVTYGAMPDHWHRLTDGTCAALIGAPYDQVARQALEACISTIRGELSGQSTYLAPPWVVKPENLAEFRHQWFEWRELPLPPASTP